MVLLAIMLACAGAVLIEVGRRGWFAGSHPFCKKCEFDLYALPQETARCPECGADILADEAIRVGRRRPMRGMALLGGVLAVAGVMLGVGELAAWAPHADFSRWKTAASLQAELNDPAEPVRRRSAEELRRRASSGRLSTSQVEKLAGMLLRYQVDPAVAWEPSWGDILQAAHRRGTLAAANWRQYLEQSMQVTAQVRPRVRIDDPVPFSLTCRLRAGSQYQEIGRATVTPEVMASAGGHGIALKLQPAKLDDFPMPMQWNALWLPAEGGNVVSEWPGDLATPGRRSLDLDVRVTLTDAHGTSAATRRHFDLPFEALARTASSVALRNDTEADAQMERAVHYRPPRSIDENGSIALKQGAPLGSLWVSGPPLPAAFRIVLRQGQREWPVARMLVRPNDAATEMLTFPAMGTMPEAGPAEIVCHPDPALATGTVDLMEVWSGQWRKTVKLAGQDSP